MRILFVAHQNYYGLGRQSGADTYAHTLLKHFIGLGWEAKAVCFGKGNLDRTIDGVQVYRRKSADKISDLASWADVILTHLGGTGAAQKAAKTFSKPLAQLIHNTNGYSIGFLGSGVDLAIYNALWVRDTHEKARESRLIQVWEKPGQSGMRFRNQKDWPSIVVRPPTEGPYLGPGNPRGKITLVNLVPNKGPDVFYALAERHPELQFMGVIGGYDLDKQDIRSLPNVQIHPHTSNLDELYSQVSMLLMPSRYESYGRVAVEGMQRGIPVLASSGPGLSECLGPDGVLLDRDDLEAWDQALMKTLENYDQASDRSQNRYLELCELTPGDLQALEIAIRRLNWGS